MTEQVIDNSSNWKPYEHTQAMVYRPYYYTAHNYPYFETRYITKYNEIYSPDAIAPVQIKLNDGTIIEDFSGKVISRGKKTPSVRQQKNTNPVSTPSLSETSVTPISKPEIEPVISKKSDVPKKPKQEMGQVISKKSDVQKKRKSSSGKKPQKVISRPPSHKPSKDLPESPVNIPSNIPKNKKKDWWRKNRYYYGDRDYYLYLNYPLWWLDYYYPLYDDYIYYGNDIYDNDYLYTDNIIYTEPNQPEQQITQPTQSVQLFNPELMIIGLIMFFIILIFISLILLIGKNI